MYTGNFTGILFGLWHCFHFSMLLVEINRRLHKAYILTFPLFYWIPTVKEFVRCIQLFNSLGYRQFHWQQNQKEKKRKQRESIQIMQRTPTLFHLRTMKKRKRKKVRRRMKALVLQLRAEEEAEESCGPLTCH